MKPQNLSALVVAASCVAASLIVGCSHGDRPAESQASVSAPVAPAPVTVPTPALAPTPLVAPTVNVGSAVTFAPDTASLSWQDMESLTYDQRAAFVAGLAGLISKLDVQIGALNAKRATMTTDTKDWDFAMKAVGEARAYLVGLVSEVPNTPPEMWNQEKDRVGSAWHSAQDACDKVRLSTAS